MKKIIFLLSVLLMAGCLHGQTSNRQYFLQAQNGEKTIRLIAEKTPYTVKTQTGADNSIEVVVARGDEIVGVFPEGTRFEPKFEDLAETSVRGLTLISETETFETQPDVIFAGEDIQNAIVSLDEAGELYIEQTDAVAKINIAVGDIIYYPPSDKFPDGYAFKIKAIKNGANDSKLKADVQDDLMCYETEPAAVDEMCTKLDITTPYCVASDINQVIEYDIDEQILPQQPFYQFAVNNPTFKLQNVIDGWSKYITNKKRLKVLSINKDMAKAEYIIFDADNDFKSDSDQVILELTLKYNLYNTHFHTDYHRDALGVPFASTFGATGNHDWTVEATLKFSPTKELVKNEELKKKWQAKVRSNMLNKQFTIMSLPLTAVAPTEIVIRPKFDVFFKITVDVDGEFKLSAGIQDVKYSFGYVWSASVPSLNRRDFNLISQGNAYATAEISGQFQAGVALGMGLTVEFPAFRLATGQKTYFGIYGNYEATATVNAKINATASEKDGLSTCFDISGKCECKPTIYAEYELYLTKKFSFSNKTENLLEKLSDATGEWYNNIKIEKELEYRYCIGEQSNIKTVEGEIVSENAIILKGEIVDKDYPIELTDKGFYYSADGNPLGENGAKISLGNGNGNFFNLLQNLTPNKTYSYVAYGTYSLKKFFGEVKTFTTPFDIYYTITASAGANGTITPSGDISALKGSSKTFTFAPNSGYVIDKVLIDGANNEAAVAAGSYTFSNVSANHTISVSFKAAGSGSNETGVLINGVRWATRNVDAPGTFAATPESAGMFYQWNRKIGWSSTDPMVNSNGGTTWDYSTPDGTEWEPANDPCPSGWRVPTYDEQVSLLNSGSSWTTQNGVTGRVFGSGSNTLFLPAAGYRDRYDGTLYSPGTLGLYRSSTQYDSSNAYYLGFGSDNADWRSNARRYGFSVRCVQE
jgi:uncharacterized protein (TIGR02145 family)